MLKVVKNFLLVLSMALAGGKTFFGRVSPATVKLGKKQGYFFGFWEDK